MRMFDAMEMAALFVVPLAALAVGLALIFTSGRANTKHLCRKCGYDLRGLPTTTRCPECGSRLDGSNTLVPGEIVTRRWQVVVGILLVVPSSLVLAFDVLIMMLARSAGA